ncbi:MAG: carboxypeptidase-like regulatory domain-containing protein, partial [Myxococcaceae bacterium]
MLAANGEPAAEVGVDVIFAARPALPAACAGILDGCACGDDLEEVLAALDLAFAPIGHATTSADGRFTVSGLPAGLLEVRAEDDDRHFASAQVQLAGRPAQLELTLDRKASPYLLAIDEKGDRQDVALIAVSRGQIVDFGRTTGDAAVSLMASLGEVTAFAPGFVPAPASGARPLVLGLAGGGEKESGLVLSMERGELLRGRLEADGADLDGVPIKATQSGRSRDGCATTVAGPDGSWVLGPVAGGSHVVTARKGGRSATFSASTVDHGQPDGSVPAKLLEDVRVHGRVVDGRKEPVRDAKLRLSWFPIEGGDGSSSEPAVDRLGHFEHRAPPGQFHLKATAKGFLEAEARSPVLKDEWEVELMLVAAAGVSGRIVSADGQPMKSVRVWGRTPEDQGISQASHIRSATTTDDGEFSLETGPGDVELEASATGYLRTKKLVRAPQAGLRLVLQRGAVVEGWVLDELRAPVAAVRVRVSPIDPTSTVFATTNPDGTFRAAGVADGPCEVTAQTPANPGQQGRVERTAKAKIEVRGAMAPFVELRLERVQAVRGRVVDPGNRPLSGVTVIAKPGEPPRISGALPYELYLFARRGLPGMPGNWPALPNAVSGPDGAFEIEGLPQGPHTLSARSGALREDPEALVAVQAGSQNVVLMLVPTRFLSAQVTSAEGQPIPKVFVGGEELEAPGGQVKVEIRFNYTGALTFRAEGYSPVSRNVTLSTRADSALGAIRFERGRTMKVKVTDARTGAALRGWVSSGGTPLNGKNDLEITAPLGAFTARVRAAGHLEATVQVTAEQTALTVALDPGATVTATVKDRDGRPPSGP